MARRGQWKETVIANTHVTQEFQLIVNTFLTIETEIT
jgi:hypothetical protein